MSYKLSIVCITYNQEKFIKEALDSFIMQKTNFDFQVIISDDCSTDNTPNIIKEYEQKYPNIIKAFYHTKNMGTIENYIFALSQSDSEYLIVNEGDDYFEDENKLQKQVDFLDANPDYSICFHLTKVIYEDNPNKTNMYPSKKTLKKELTFNKLLKGNFMQTNSVLYRWNKEYALNFPRNILPCDWYLHLCHAQIGKIGVINEIMSVYRRNINGIWTDSDATNKNLHRKHGIKEINFYNAVYENLTNKSENYLNNTFLPMFKQIIDNYYNFGDIEKILEIKNLYPTIFAKAMNIENPTNKKLKKYKKIYTILLISCILLLIFNIIQILLHN